MGVWSRDCTYICQLFIRSLTALRLQFSCDVVVTRNARSVLRHLGLCSKHRPFQDRRLDSVDLNRYARENQEFPSSKLLE